MKINNAHRLENEAGDQLVFPNVGGGIPNDSPKVQDEQRIIVIHAPASGVEGWIRTEYLNPDVDF